MRLLQTGRLGSGRNPLRTMTDPLPMQNTMIDTIYILAQVLGTLRVMLLQLEYRPDTVAKVCVLASQC